MTATESGLDKYAVGLEKGPANFRPLTPLSFLDQAAANFPSRVAMVHGDVALTYAEFHARCRRLASALRARGVRRGDTVALIAPNVPAALEAHYGVPMAGAVLNPVNIRLDPEAIAFILRHGEARAVITDCELSATVGPALELLGSELPVFDIEDPLAEGAGTRLGELTYEELLAEGDPEFQWIVPEDEWDPIALSYTSGTTGDPKGVVYHHRGAYLAGFGQVASWGMPRNPVYLWTLPMFHSYGWCFPWTISIMGGTHVFLRKIDPATIFRLIRDHDVTHLCAAPIVLNMLINAPAETRVPFARRVQVMTAGSSPPPTVLEGMHKLGFDVIHAYGLTECTGCVTICHLQADWGELSPQEWAERNARQGLRYPTFDGMYVADPETMEPVPHDGATMGEILVRGSPVMRGYLKNPAATEKAFAGGWFHTGDIAVVHPDGYLQIRDRSKDVIISGGENISSVEVEGVLYRHPAVLEAAVVARPDPKWEESPCAFVTLREGASATEADIIAFCRANMAHYKCPRTVVFGPLPKTATGKIQKFQLREIARSLEG